MTENQKNLQDAWMLLVKIHILTGEIKQAVKMIKSKGYEGEAAIKLINHLLEDS